jgi:hypothetical protein
MNYNEFLNRIKEIKDMGFVKSHRKGDTGIGKTLEDLLGITENNIAGPDFSVYELKSGRKDSSSMLTLFTKTPMPKNAIKALVEVFGYKKRKKSKDKGQEKLSHFMSVKIEEGKEKVRPEDKELHVTVDAVTENSVGLVLKIQSNRIFIGNNKNVEAYYDKSTLKETLEKKYAKLIYVSAERKKKDNQEYLWFEEAYLFEGFSFKTFSEFVKKGIIKLDLRIGHYPDGRPHDHGTGFRVMPKYLPQCFEKRKKIL